jgi:hypothetical protein
MNAMQIAKLKNIAARLKDLQADVEKLLVPPAYKHWINGDDWTAEQESAGHSHRDL